MNKKVKFLSLFILFSLLLGGTTYAIGRNAHNTTAAISLSANGDHPTFDHVIFITWDGVRPHWIDALTANGSLVNTNRVLANGYIQKVRITNHEPGTGPGLSTMETGYGPEIHGIYYNQFGPGSPKDSIPDGLTTPERLKKAFGDQIKIGFFLPWSFHQINETYMNQVGNYTDSIFENVKPGREVDYWFASENLTWMPWDNESKAAAYHGFNEKHQLYYDPLIKASYLAQKMAEFIANYSSSRFYIRAHFTEPDNVGHGYGESNKTGSITPEYFEALMQCDNATGIVLDALEAAGILSDTLVIIGTDHGFYKENHQGSPWPNNRMDVVEPHYIISSKSIMPVNGIAVDQMDLSPTILGVLGVDLSTITPAYVGDQNTGLPFWERSDNSAPVLRTIKYQCLGDDAYADFTNGSSLSPIFNLSLTITEWSNIKAVTLKIENITIEADNYTNLAVVWYNINLKNIPSGTYVIVITIVDSFDNSAVFAREFNLSIATSKGSFVIIGLIACMIVAPIFIKRKKYE